MANLNDINLTTVVQLKEKCISHGLSIAGKKADLFERLKEYEEKRNAAAAAPGENPVPAVKDESTKATVDGNLETSVIKTDDKSDEKLMAEVEAVINDGVNVEVKDVKNENAAECEKTGSKTNEVSSTEENTPKTLSVAEKYDQQMKEILETLKKKHSCETITDEILKEFLCDKVEEDIFCKLCVFKAQGGEELVLEDHFQSETHKTRYEGYKEKCLDNGNFLRVISHCEICKKEIPYDVFNKHETGAKHLLNKMLTENGVAPMKLDRAQIQEELDAINTAEDPVPGIKFVIEEINGEDMETFSIKYFCLACRLVNDKKLSPEEMIEHIKSKAHKIGSLRRLSNRAFKAVQAMVNAYNSSKPVKSVALDLGDECANYIKKNVSQFYRKMTISTNIWIGGIKNIEMHHQGDDFSFAEEIEAREKAREKARMDGRNRREQGRKDAKNKNAEGKQDKDTATTVEKNTFENTEAKIQKLVNENITDIIGIEYLIERHYPDGVLDYHCSTCGKELGTDQSAAIVHFTHFRHKKAYLKRNKKEEHENMIKRAKDTKNSDRDINLEIQRLTEEVSQKFLDSKTERPKVRVTVKDGPRKDTQPARQRKRKQSISKGGPEKKPDISGNKVSTIGTGGRKGVSKKRGAGGGFGGGSGGGGGGGFGNAKKKKVPTATLR